MRVPITAFQRPVLGPPSLPEIFGTPSAGSRTNRPKSCQLLSTILPADVPLRRRFNAGLHLPIDATLGKSSSYGVAMKTETEVVSPQRDICGHLRTSEKCASPATFLNHPLARRLSARMPVQVTPYVLSTYLVGNQAWRCFGGIIRPEVCVFHPCIAMPNLAKSSTSNRQARDFGISLESRTWLLFRNC